MIRLVRRTNGMVIIDRAGTSPGRGAYVCPVAECVGEALKRGRLAKAFRERAEGSAELVALYESLTSGAREG